jgi:hypothetical protein
MHFLLGGLFWRLQEAVGSAAGLNQNIAVTRVAACSSFRVSCTHIYAFIFTNFIYLCRSDVRYMVSNRVCSAV